MVTVTEGAGKVCRQVSSEKKNEERVREGERRGVVV